jgi:hypothetical protein
LIEDWFAQNAGDGEFARNDRFVPYSLIAPGAVCGRIILTTKPHIIAEAVEECEKQEALGMVGRYGLPSAGDEEWVRRLVGDCEISFLGDLDPVDLMIYVWWREKLSPRPVGYLGISDTYLAAVEASIPDRFLQRLTPSEQRSIPLLKQIFGDVFGMIGQRCAGWLRQSCKLELEAVASAKSLDAILRPVLPS